ncbi:hypothetical protein KY310_03660 [Candidatus Woesearchaeota archaeon]|nr:hypothetical protein [Candidatus Woesearchaeota archaeon]
MSEKKDVKYEKPVKYEDKKEAPIKYDSEKPEPAKENFNAARYGTRGRPTTHKDYHQPRPITATYMMLDPRTMYVHDDPSMAMKNYVRMSPGIFNHYKGGKKAA